MKDLKQIQEENRKLILEANPQDGILKVMQETLGESPIYLNHVLIALLSVEGWDFCFYGKLFIVARYDIEAVRWNLTKQTLEEQTEETQRAIWELLNK